MAILLLVPEGKGEVLEAVRVADAGNAILAPAIRPRPGMIVREVFRTARGRLARRDDQACCTTGDPLAIPTQDRKQALTAPSITIRTVVLPHCNTGGD